MSTISNKICLIGDFGVGKTSLIRRFVDRQFSDKYLSTVGVKISRKSIEVTDKQRQEHIALQLLIWDIEGSTKFKRVSASYFQGAKGAIIVGDVTRPESLENLSEHIQAFLKVNPKGKTAIALNKSDLIDAEYLDKYCQLYSFNDNESFVSTFASSAKTGENVDKIFQSLAHSMI
ncbi:small GTP-binding protein domain protein [Rivularia sp. PCC 7116]|uniref:Rab family GTPase n=1 Tax=Rivularia sp. PCC 7116 TaxID=373994 RepID=UPI00029F2542|nr:Rab family GTPase [Rivularia sp. PCC 7116]AFY53550.1 small GTP-binding protein domain protein [Rivularia sp. PCC 7116]